MATAQTARPARTRSTTARKATPAKAAAAAKAEAPEAVEVPEVEAYVMELEQMDDTKSYSRWTPPKGSGCVGTFYAPLGTKAVRVKISG